MMSVNKSFYAIAFGSSLLMASAGYAAPPERMERAAEREEQIARSEIRRGEAMEQEAHRLERQGQWRRGEMLEQRGEYLERHGRQMLRQAERRERFAEGR